MSTNGLDKEFKAIDGKRNSMEGHDEYKYPKALTPYQRDLNNRVHIDRKDGIR